MGAHGAIKSAAYSSGWSTKQQRKKVTLAYATTGQIAEQLLTGMNENKANVGAAQNRFTFGRVSLICIFGTV